MSKEKAIFTALARRSAPNMESYLGDLEHDKKWIMDTNASIPFIHVTRKHGTDLYPMHPVARFPLTGKVKFLFGTANYREILSSYYDGLRYSLESAELVQYFDGSTVYVISHESALTKWYGYMADVIYKIAMFHGTKGVA